MPSGLIPDPLHPAVVHLPIALVLLLPLFAAGAIVAIRKGARPLVAWGLTLAMAAALVGSAWIATETGEQQEERVENVVGDVPMHAHEEAAESFLALAFIVLVAATPGLSRRRLGKFARAAGLVGSLGLVWAGWNVGRSGGELVYEHGAASAYGATPEAGQVHAATRESDDD